MGFVQEFDDWLKVRANEEWGIALEILIVLYCFSALAIICEEYMAPALETLCIRWHIREDVAGATFLAFGSAAPEIVINAVATIKSQMTSNNSTSLGISAIIGSGMIAFSCIPAMCAFVSEIELKLKRRPLFRDQAFYLLALCTLCIAFHDGKITILESSMLVLVYVGHLTVVVFSPFIRKKYRHIVKGIVPNNESFVHKMRKQLEEHRSSINVLAHSPKQSNDSSIACQSPAFNFVKDESINSFTNEYIKENTSNILIINNSSTNEQNSKLQIINNLYKENLNINRIISIGDDSSCSASQIYHHLHEKNNENETKADDKIKQTKSKLRIIIHWFTMPLQLLFRYTCPPAGEGQCCERLYFLTFLITVVHVSLFSYVLSSVISAWVNAWNVPQALFGMLLIAVGAEIPDSIESMTMARKGYGSMAVSNCQGTQVINIGIGLGLPWMIANIIDGSVVNVNNHQMLQISAFFQTFLVLCNFILLVGFAIYQKKNKAVLSNWKAILLIGIYMCVIIAFGVYLIVYGDIK